jgi:hypothetical protein
MAFISSRVFVAGGTKKLLSLTNEEFVRYIGTDWTTIRIGLLCAIVDNAGGTVVGRLAVGVCSGQTNPCGVNPTTNFAGARVLNGSNWTYNANAGDPYFSNGSFYGLRRVANVDTTAGIANTTVNIVTTAPGNGGLQRRSLLLVDISKAGSEIPYFTQSTQVANDFTYVDFLAALDWQPVTPIIRNLTMGVATSQAVSLDPTPGAYDNVDIHWTGTAQALEIYALGIYRRS